MYTETKKIIYSAYNFPYEADSFFGHLWTNGVYIRNSRGIKLGKFGKNDDGIFFIGTCEGENFSGNITDKLLCERIPKYFAAYYDNQPTNCAAMAHFLTTGKFVECVKNQNGMLVLEQGMRPLAMSSKIELGDMVCILYAKERITSTRRLPDLHKKFMVAKRCHHKNGEFTGSIPMKTRSFNPQEIKDLYSYVYIEDFHFMVCVGFYKGEPMFLSQMGYVKPGGQKNVVILTKGTYNPYQDSVPLFTFIKKRC